MALGAELRKPVEWRVLAVRRALALPLLFPEGMETVLDTTPRRLRADDPRRGDVFDAILRWAHRLLNPPNLTPARARMGDRRRSRDRVPV